MIVSLNLKRELVDIQLERGDDISTRSVQIELRKAQIPFKTIRASGQWTVSSDRIVHLTDALTQFGPMWDSRFLERLVHARTDNRLARIAEGTESLLNHRLECSATLGQTPYPEQLEAARLMSAPMVRQFALFWKPGSGKTGALIVAAHELLSRGIAKAVLIVAERPMAIEFPWMHELETWKPYMGQSQRPVPVAGSKRQRLEKYYLNAEWTIVHYGILKNDEYPIKSWASRNEGAERPIIIFDESDLIKNPNAHRSKTALAIRQEFGRCWIASGTPAPNSPADYQHQLSVLSGYPVDLQLTGDRQQDAVVAVHTLEKGVFYLQQDNPRRMPETTTPVKVDLSPPQREEYERLAKNLLIDLEEMDDVEFANQITHVMARRMALLRLCSDPGHHSLPKPMFDEPSKSDCIDSLLETILDHADEKVVIWTRFRDTATILHDRYSNKYRAALMLGGGIGTPEALSDPECRLLVATIQVGASSIDLTMARNAIYESMDDVSRNFVQSMARINRTGQAKDCRYWFLITRNTVEEDLFENTIAKMQLSEDVLDEIGKPGRAQMIEMLRRSIETASESA